ncbi:MAG: hypothetical protein P1V18_05530 [Candidatus Gracilibacteria bacterium]|nr:hypothetical protein [Candidatus Gracilibacteria bacterium]
MNQDSSTLEVEKKAALAFVAQYEIMPEVERLTDFIISEPEHYPQLKDLSVLIKEESKKSTLGEILNSIIRDGDSENGCICGRPGCKNFPNHQESNVKFEGIDGHEMTNTLNLLMGKNEKPKQFGFILPGEDANKIPSHCQDEAFSILASRVTSAVLKHIPFAMSRQDRLLSVGREKLTHEEIETKQQMRELKLVMEKLELAQKNNASNKKIELAKKAGTLLRAQKTLSEHFPDIKLNYAEKFVDPAHQPSEDQKMSIDAVKEGVY